MVGTSYDIPFVTPGHAYRYVHGNPGTVTAIPFLAGGGYNGPIELSPDGNLALVAGNSTAFPNGEIYLYNFQTLATTPLGSPNAAWSPVPYGGMTADGSAVVMSFFDGVTRRGFLRNSHGWFPLESALTASGIDVTGWDVNNIAGLSVAESKELVSGSAQHNGNTEGFVAQFPAGYLAAFNPQLTGTFQGLVPAQGLLFTPPGACNGYNATFAVSQFGNQIFGTADLIPTGGVCTDLRSIEQSPFQVLPTRVVGAVNGTAVSLAILSPRLNMGVPNQITAVLASGTMDGQHLTLSGSVITRRTWLDINGNVNPDCNLANPAANGECGADSLSPQNFTLTATRVP
jgi:hypothetical protein